MSGQDLIKQIIEETGLPHSLISQELLQLINKAGLKANELSIDELREVLVEYLQETLLEAKLNHEK